MAIRCLVNQLLLPGVRKCRESVAEDIPLKEPQPEFFDAYTENVTADLVEMGPMVDLIGHPFEQLLPKHLDAK